MLLVAGTAVAPVVVAPEVVGAEVSGEMGSDLKASTLGF